uniref:Uncharacterized protein n=1 Tax=Megaselia scalaris TaxID=36166 RepID=T1GLS7_MEGSC
MSHFVIPKKLIKLIESYIETGNIIYNSVELSANGSKTKLIISSKNQQRHNDLGSNITMRLQNIVIVKDFRTSEVASDNNKPRLEDASSFETNNKAERSFVIVSGLMN